MYKRVLLTLCGITFCCWATGLTERLVAFFLNASKTEEVVPIGGPFVFQDTDGSVVKDTDFRGQYMLVYYG